MGENKQSDDFVGRIRAWPRSIKGLGSSVFLEKEGQYGGRNFAISVDDEKLRIDRDIFPIYARDQKRKS